MPRELYHKERPSFLLEKWYMDLVTTEGDCWIFYGAALHWRRLRIPFSKWIHLSREGKQGQGSSLKKTGLPVAETGRIAWKNPRLKMEGEWRSGSTPVSQVLYSNENGFLQWNCYQPAAIASVKVNGILYTGSGYAEELLLTMLPGDLPVDQLCWGRFGCGENELVWIETLYGDLRKQWVFYNGKKQGNSLISDEMISIPEEGLELKLINSTPVNKPVKLSKTLGRILNLLPGFRRVLPSRVLLAEDKKWRSRGILYKEGNEVSASWVIHERVIFKK